MGKEIRLSEKEIEAIREVAKEVFGEGARVFLFGSRVNPELKGGDIDLFIEVPEERTGVEEKLKFLVKLKEKIGEQKVDVVVSKVGSKDFISQEAKRTGVLL